MTPTFSDSYQAPGAYIDLISAGNPQIPQSPRVHGIVGQGRKTLPRTQGIIKGVANGQDGPLANNTVIAITGVTDSNGVTYVQGSDYQLTRTNGGTNAVVDWSLLASLEGTADLATAITYPGQLDGQQFNLNLNGVIQNVVFTAPANAAAIASQINAWVGSTVASLGAGNILVLAAKSIAILPSVAGLAFGFVNGQSASANQPATGVTYTVSYTSDRLITEYGLQAFTNLDALIAAMGPLNPQTVLASGSVASAAPLTLTAPGVSWTENMFQGQYVTITGGLGEGQVRVIISNTGNTITISQPWTQYSQPNTSSTYAITDYNDNSISRGAWGSQRMGCSQWVVSQYPDNIFDPSDMQAAIDAMGTSVNGLAAEVVTVMHGIDAATDTGIIDYIANRVNTDNSVLSQNLQKCAILGMVDGTDTAATYIGLAPTIANGFLYLVGIAECPIDFGVGAGTEILGGEYWAALVAGAYCAYTQVPGNSLMGVSFANAIVVNAFQNPFTQTETNQIAGAGCITVGQSGNSSDITVVNDLSTNQSGPDDQAKLSYARRKIYIAKTTQTYLNGVMKGRTITKDMSFLGILTGGLSAIYDQMEAGSAPTIYDYTTPTAAQDADVPEQIDISTPIAIVADVVWIYNQIAVSVG
jgi:hypothetical protein